MLSLLVLLLVFLLVLLEAQIVFWPPEPESAVGEMFLKETLKSTSSFEALHWRASGLNTV